MKSFSLLRASLVVLACALTWVGAVDAQAATHRIDIPAGDLAHALKELARQAGVELIYRTEQLKGLKTQGVRGDLAAEDAARKLVAGTSLTVRADSSGALSIAAVEVNGVNLTGIEAQMRMAQTGEKPSSLKAAPKEEEQEAMDTRGTPEMLVKGSKVTNADIKRSEGDPQPYVVFDREQIARSGASSLEQFFQQRLTMNTARLNTGGGSINSGFGASTSQVSLRGLGASQTLILIDGHRASSPSLNGALSQTDINSVPLGAIERIEILPTTASGIYGGNATGGVINIILRRDFTGGEVSVGYENTFESDVAGRKMGLTFGRSLHEGRTSVLLSGSYSDANELLVRERDFTQRGRAAIRANAPQFFIMPNGLPPLSNRPNISSIGGENLVLKNGTALNASFTSVPAGYAGVLSDNGARLAATAGTYNWDLADTVQPDGGSRQAFWTQPQVQSVGAVVRHRFDSGLQVYADLSYSDSVNRFPASRHSSLYYLPISSAANPFQQDIYVSLPVVDQGDSISKTKIEHSRAVIGAIQQLPRGWQLAADYTWDRTQVTYGSGVFSPNFGTAVFFGSVDVLRDTQAAPLDVTGYTGQANLTSPFRSTLNDVSLRISGPVWDAPGGPATVSASTAYREEAVPDAVDGYPTSGTTQIYPHRSQHVISAYAELRVPLVSQRNARSGLHDLQLQLAVRRDQYASDSGQLQTFQGALPNPLPAPARSHNDFSSVDPTIAVLWAPLKSLALRASYGTGFLPPALSQLVPTINPNPGCTSLSDPRRGGTPAAPCRLITGGNPNLKPEESTSWSVGMVLKLEALAGMRLSVDYTAIDKSDIIGVHPLFYQGLLNDEALFPGRIIRGPNLPTDPAGWAGPIQTLDFSVFNLANAELKAWDVQLDFNTSATPYGSFEWFLMGTWQPHYRTQTVSTQPFRENAGVTSGNPLKFKANAGLVWSLGVWQAGWNVNHYGGYNLGTDARLMSAQGNGGKIASQTYHDVFVKLGFGGSGVGAFSQWPSSELQFGVRNVFNKEPPLDASNAYGFYSLLGDPRLASYYLSLKTEF